MRTRSRQAGFSLIELMIVIVIIGILAGVSIPQYFIYTQKAKFADLVQQTNSLKTAVQLCIEDTNTVTGCTSNSNGIATDITVASGNLRSLTTLNGTITVTAIPALNDHTYVLTPVHTASTSTTSWNVSGSCFAAQICRQ